MNEPEKIVLSESVAKKYFGNADPLGKKLIFRHQTYTLNFEVTGVFKEFPAHSHLQISHLASYPTLTTIAHFYGDTTNMMETSTSLYDFYTYLELKANTDTLITLIITIMTISFQCIKMATANPVKSLRAE